MCAGVWYYKSCEFVGTHDVLRIQLKQSPEELEENGPATFLLPFVKEMVPRVDAEGRKMYISPPEGLLDLAVPIKRSDKPKRQMPRNQRRRQKKTVGEHAVPSAVDAVAPPFDAE